MIGKTVSHFRILEKLGEGGMGVVYKAEDARLQRTVALKFISRTVLGSDRAAARFIREAQAAAACEHPNVCTIYEVDDSDKGAFIAMACIEGRSLRDQLVAGPLDSSEAVDIATQVARGLQAAHSRGIVHRDIKPGNIMITPSGLVKIMDFGLAKPPEADQITGVGSAVGTVAYMSPEQARGEEVDERTDIWALGVVLYEMLSGRRPFRGHHSQAVVYSILSEDPDPLTDAQPGVPAGLERITSKALAKSPAERYQRVEEMLAKLEALQLGTDVGATRPLGVREPDPAPHGNLPLQLTSFVGRDKVVTDIKRLLGQSRLLTLTGAGGCGKTRLALELGAAVLNDYPDGVWLAELAPVREGSLVPQTVATALGLKETAGRTPTETLIDYLSGRSVLLVLDNCEHLLTECAQLADGLLRTCPGLRLLTTSREGLRIAGEAIYRVPSLAVPEVKDGLPLDELGEVEAIQLFVERAAALKTEFSLTGENASAVAEICRQLDGIPLAIELAAARIPVLPATQIVQLLNDRFRLLTAGSRTSLPRHQTLRATIDWSYDRLSASEQILFRRLSVYAGGWTLRSAEAVCAGSGIQASDVLGLMSSLAEKSVVEVAESHGETEGVRYRMLETIREYAFDRLLEEGEVARVLSQHRDFFISLAEEAERHAREETGPMWRATLTAEHDNLRVALNTCTAEDGDGLLGLRLAGALGLFWGHGGHWTEGRSICSQLLARADARERTAARAKVLSCAGGLAYNQSDFAEAHSLLRESLAITREFGDQEAIMDLLRSMGAVTSRLGDIPRARSLCEEGLAISRELGNKVQMSRSLHTLGMLASLEGDSVRALALHEEGLMLCREVGDRRGEAWALGSLGNAAYRQGEYARALPFFEESLATLRELGGRKGVNWSLSNLAQLLLDRGDIQEAGKLLEQVLRSSRELRDRGRIVRALLHLGRIRRLEGDLGGARTMFEEGLAIARETGRRGYEPIFLSNLGHVFLKQGDGAQALSRLVESLAAFRQLAEGRQLADHADVARSLEIYGMLAVRLGELSRAVRFFGAAQQLRDQASRPLALVDRQELNGEISTARSELGEDAFAHEWTCGQALSMEEAIKYALSANDDEVREGGRRTTGI